MRRVLGFCALLALAAGLAIGTAGTVTGQEDQTGYDDTAVLAEEEQLPKDAHLFALDLTQGDESFDQEIPPGSFLDVVADGFGPNTDATIELASERLTLAFVTADDEGVIRRRLQLPYEVELGDHTLHVVGVDPEGNPRDVTIAIKIGVPDGGSDWPAWAAGSIAAALAIMGLFLYRLQRVRQRPKEDVGAVS